MGRKSTFYNPVFLFETIRVTPILWKNPLVSVENLQKKAGYPHRVSVINSLK